MIAIIIGVVILVTALLLGGLRALGFDAASDAAIAHIQLDAFAFQLIALTLLVLVRGAVAVGLWRPVDGAAVTPIAALRWLAWGLIIVCVVGLFFGGLGGFGLLILPVGAFLAARWQH
jgi:hypothetical protein